MVNNDNNEKKELIKHENADYEKIELYATSESVSNQWCTDYSGSTVRIYDGGTVRCN